MTLYLLSLSNPNGKEFYLMLNDDATMDKNQAIKFQTTEAALLYQEESKMRRFYTVTEHQFNEPDFETESRN